MNNNKKTVIWHSNISTAKTGLGRNTRAIMEYLYKTDKYNLILYAQGVLYESHEYSRFPYKVIGCLPNNQQEIDNINRDPNYARFAAYGGHMIDKIIQDEKPDAMIFSDDSWAYPHISKPWFNKFPCVYHITIDSLPVLEEAFKQASATPYFLTWTDFSNSEFHKRGHNHVKSIPGAVDNKFFYKLGGFQKLELKHKYNLPPNSFIIGFVFRNQLRKEVGPLIEGYSIWKKNNPQAKNTYLLFHTHWSEPEGWDIHKFCETYGVDKKEILTTYICKNCLDIEVKPFDGQDKDCKFCGSPGVPPNDKNPSGSGQITCNTMLGCTETQLNEVYNLMDCYCHLMNAGGLEIPIIESLYCELPTATVPYSSGETFTRNSFVSTIDCSYTLQRGTQFKRACPYPSSVAKFIDKIYKLDIKKRQEIGKKSREWAINTFSPEVVGKQWEQLIDSLPEHNYDFNFKEELKNPDFPMPDMENDEEFITSLYQNILKCDPDEDGKKNWLSGLKNGQTRQQIYDFFIGLARQQNESKQQIQLEDLFDKNDPRERVLLVIPCSLGDCIISTSLIPEILKKHPIENYQIYLSTDPKYFEVFSEFTDLIKLIPFTPILRSEMATTGAGNEKGIVDHFYDLTCSSQIHLNYLTSKY